MLSNRGVCFAAMLSTTVSFILHKKHHHLAMLSFVSTMPYHFRILRECTPALPLSCFYPHKNTADYSLPPCRAQSLHRELRATRPFPRELPFLTTLQLILLPQLSAELFNCSPQRLQVARLSGHSIRAYFFSQLVKPRTSLAGLHDSIETRHQRHAPCVKVLRFRCTAFATVCVCCNFW